ncbi:DUF2809 domain-containing protein [Fibrella sp. WM1]|uniref:ribosomal maturation YjgA family protein n=1 Tax=Fibrella musci TaxID=3242485 RepID=UPI003521BE6E
MKGATERNRLVYTLLIVVVLLVGLASRHGSASLPPFVRTYVGDVLWALMVFLGFATLLNRQPTKTIALLAILFAFGIEGSQLYHAPWIDSLRATRLGGLVLGFGFLWSDLLCYSLGIAIGAALDRWIGSATRRRRARN